jgi:hypothetical protein
MGRTLYSRWPPFVPQRSGLRLGENGMEALFFTADEGTVSRRRYADLESIFPFPSRGWWRKKATGKGDLKSDSIYPSLFGLQFETFDGQVCALELARHSADVVMAVLKDRLGSRWEEVFQDRDGKPLPPSYWGRYHKLIHLEPGRERYD